MANNIDPKGYYARLGVPPSASAEDIKKAYRARAMDLHPDRNPGKDSTLAFQELQEAYEILSDAKTRAEYDAIGIEAEQEARATDDLPIEPIVCSKCGCVSAQPRYVIFHEIKSYVFVTYRSARQGIFCAECATREALKASAFTWFLGWWCFPWGPIFTVKALFTNLLGGERPQEPNARIMAYQAAFFAANGQIDLARAVAMEALALAIKIKTPMTSLRRRLGYDADETEAKLIEQIKSMLQTLDDGLPFKQLKPQWGFFNRILAQQLVMALMFCGVITWVVMLQEAKPSTSPPVTPSVSSAEASTPAALLASAPAQSVSFESPLQQILSDFDAKSQTGTLHLASLPQDRRFQNLQDFLGKPFAATVRGKFSVPGIPDLTLYLISAVPAPPAEYGCHPCSPFVGALLTHIDAEGKEVQSGPLQPLGTFGEFGEFDLNEATLEFLKVGPGRIGFSLKDRELGQGELFETVSFYGVESGKIRYLTSIDTRDDASSSIGCAMRKGKPCANYQASVQFIPTKQGPYFPIKVVETGFKWDSDFNAVPADGSYWLRFNGIRYVRHGAVHQGSSSSPVFLPPASGGVGG